jgi:hypothetical protein
MFLSALRSPKMCTSPGFLRKIAPKTESRV